MRGRTGQFAPRSGGETPRLIEPMPHVRAGGFAGKGRSSGGEWRSCASRMEIPKISKTFSL